MNQYKIRRMLCKRHQFQVDSICCSNHCNLTNICCKLCAQEHQSHLGNLMPLNKLESAIKLNLEQQNKLDVLTLKENDGLIYRINKYRNQFNEREQKLLNSIVQIFQVQKNELIEHLQKQGKASYQKNLRYIQKLTRHKNMMMRVKFSSKKGLQFFNQCSNNLNQSYSMFKSMEQSEINSKTLTSILSSLIKLKISKKDAMKISCGQKKSQKQFQKISGPFPPSPNKNRKPLNPVLN